jgi:uncharacterized Zn-finger protein
MDKSSRTDSMKNSHGSTKHSKKSASESSRKYFKCSICVQEFATENLLREHEEIHVTPYCHTCSKMFKSSKLLRVHHQNYHSDIPEPHSSTSKESNKNHSINKNLPGNDLCEDLSLHKVKEEPIELVSEPEIANLLNHDPHQASNSNLDYYPEQSKSFGLWRNFTATPPSSFLALEHSSVPLSSIKLEPPEVPDNDQFDFIINEILKKPSADNAASSRLSLVAEEISLQQNFWTQSDYQQERNVWICDICSKQFTTKQILQRHRIATHDQNKDFKCDQCDTWFSSSNNHELIKHVNEVHNGFKKFICDFPGCNKEFSRRDALKRHRTCHEKSRNAVIQHPTKMAHHHHLQPYYKSPHLTRH